MRPAIIEYAGMLDRITYPSTQQLTIEDAQ